MTHCQSAMQFLNFSCLISRRIFTVLDFYGWADYRKLKWFWKSGEERTNKGTKKEDNNNKKTAEG